MVEQLFRLRSLVITCQVPQWYGSWPGHIATAPVTTGFETRRVWVSREAGSEGMFQGTISITLCIRDVKGLAAETRQIPNNLPGHWEHWLHCFHFYCLLWCKGRIPAPGRSHRLYQDSGPHKKRKYTRALSLNKIQEMVNRQRSETWVTGNRAQVQARRQLDLLWQIIKLKGHEKLLSWGTGMIPDSRVKEI